MSSIHCRLRRSAKKACRQQAIFACVRQVTRSGESVAGTYDSWNSPNPVSGRKGYSCTRCGHWHSDGKCPFCPLSCHLGIENAAGLISVCFREAAPQQGGQNQGRFWAVQIFFDFFLLGVD